MFKKTKEKPPKPKETPSESISGIAGVLVSGLFIITFVVQAFEIPSRSMERTLLVGDHVFVDRLTPALRSGYLGPLMPYRDVKRGDIVVFISPEERGLYVVKRIIGVPGDHIHLRNGVVYLNGQAQSEPYALHNPNSYVPYRDDFPAIGPEGVGEIAPEWPVVLRQHIEGDDLVIPPDSYFGMGDNRDVSLDSRFWGFIPRQNVIGRPLFIYWSFDTPEDQYQRTSVGERVKFIVHVALNFFGQTRWKRMFRLVR
ncbi:MAG TPA: signal peptidase I [Candidatus Angelobacter sp.]|nr:signal peptidase I [Candidatus Angelobacter sp.]